MSVAEVYSNFVLHFAGKSIWVDGPRYLEASQQTEVSFDGDTLTADNVSGTTFAVGLL